MTHTRAIKQRSVHTERLHHNIMMTAFFYYLPVSLLKALDQLDYEAALAELLAELALPASDPTELETDAG